MPADKMNLEGVARKMQADWDQRAKDNALHYVNDEVEQWSTAEFFRTGEENIEEEVLTDMGNICQGKPPKEMRVLEIGCGVGRLTRPLARLFGEVHAVDISSEMVARARENLAGFPNAFVYCNNGFDLSVIPPAPAFDFAFSYIVFQHIPAKDVILNYVREVNRLLRPGALFKFQVQGHADAAEVPDTWHGVPISDTGALQMAEDSGFECRYRHGAGTQYFWLWYFKK